MSAGKDVIVLGLKKVHVIVAAIAGIVTPSVVVTASFYKAKSELEGKINTIQLQNVNTFAKADDVKTLNKALTGALIDIREDLGEIKGRLGIRSRPRVHRPSDIEGD